MIGELKQRSKIYSRMLKKISIFGFLLLEMKKLTYIEKCDTMVKFTLRTIINEKLLKKFI